MRNFIEESLTGWGIPFSFFKPGKRTAHDFRQKKMASLRRIVEGGASLALSILSDSSGNIRCVATCLSAKISACYPDPRRFNILSQNCKMQIKPKVFSFITESAIINKNSASKPNKIYVISASSGTNFHDTPRSNLFSPSVEVIMSANRIKSRLCLSASDYLEGTSYRYYLPFSFSHVCR